MMRAATRAKRRLQMVDGENGADDDVIVLGTAAVDNNDENKNQSNTSVISTPSRSNTKDSIGTAVSKKRCLSSLPTSSPTTPSSKKEKKSAVVVTPSSSTISEDDNDITLSSSPSLSSSNARRALNMSSPSPSLVTISEESADEEGSIQGEPVTTATTIKGPFGRDPGATIDIQHNTRTVYKLISRQTGQIGGNGSFGAIYGELTVGSMQRVINLMKDYTNFTSKSKFIDIGSGLGKPNLHVTQDPGVCFSYGIEMEYSRYILGLANLKQTVDTALLQQQEQNEKEVVVIEDDGNTKIKHQCYFEHGNIKRAKTFDPFTHVYAFSIGFPPNLWEALSRMFNKSTASRWLICYAPPHKIIKTYGFDVGQVTQMQTSMHGSAEGHMCYVYERINATANNSKINEDKCDPLFRDGYNHCKKSTLKQYHAHVNNEHRKHYKQGRITRSKKHVMCIEE